MKNVMHLPNLCVYQFLLYITLQASKVQPLPSPDLACTALCPSPLLHSDSPHQVNVAPQHCSSWVGDTVHTGEESDP